MSPSCSLSKFPEGTPNSTVNSVFKQLGKNSPGYLGFGSTDICLDLVR